MSDNRRNGGNGIGLKIFSAIVSILLAISVAIPAICFGTGIWQVATEDKPVQEQPDDQTPDEEQPDDQDPDDQKPEETPGEEQPADEGGMQVGEAEENGISLTSAKIAPADYAEYGIEPLADTAFSITATVTPANATDKSITLSLTFENPASSWASGKTVTDYVKLSTTTVQSGVPFTLTCSGEFGERITLTATANGGNNVKASTSIDYIYRFTEIGVVAGEVWYNEEFYLDSEQIYGDSTGNIDISLASYYGYNGNINSNWDDSNIYTDWLIKPYNADGGSTVVGTRYEDITNVSIQFVSNLSNYRFDPYVFMYPRNNDAPYEASSYGVYHIFCNGGLAWGNLYYDMFDYNFLAYLNNDSAKQAFRDAIVDADNIAMTLEISFEGVDTGIEYSFEIPLYADLYELDKYYFNT